MTNHTIGVCTKLEFNHVYPPPTGNSIVCIRNRRETEACFILDFYVVLGSTEF